MKINLTYNFRIGSATSAKWADMSDVDIKMLGRWKSDVRKYVKMHVTHRFSKTQFGGMKFGKIQLMYKEILDKIRFWMNKVWLICQTLATPNFRCLRYSTSYYSIMCTHDLMLCTCFLHITIGFNKYWCFSI